MRIQILGLALVTVVFGCSPAGEPAAEGPHVTGAATSELTGAYIATIGGCHDCHTPGFLEAGWAVSDSVFLTGSPLGWRGPWGTTYAPNLRLTVAGMTEDEWVTMLRTRDALPPMPWPNINRMSEPDMRALYRYIRSLGPGGTAAPANVPPDQAPSTPYITIAPPQMP